MLELYSPKILAFTAAIDGYDDKLSTIINAADNACQIAKDERLNRVHTVVQGAK